MGLPFPRPAHPAPQKSGSRVAGSLIRGHRAQPPAAHHRQLMVMLSR